MTDKELIELAAKAYGFGDQEGNFIWTESEYPRGSKTNGALWNYMGWCDTAQLWNPLTDDADAFRLANKVQLTVYHAELAVVIKHKQYSWDWLGEGVNEDTGDRDASTRRAIVRAAAQIGKEME